MTRRVQGPRLGAAILAAAGVLLLLAAAAQAAVGGPAHNAPVRALGGSGVAGGLSLAEARDGGTAFVLVARGLEPGALVRVRLHAGTRPARLSASSTRLATAHAGPRGLLRVSGRVLYRGREPVALREVADGEHTVVLVVDGRIVAAARTPTA